MLPPRLAAGAMVLVWWGFALVLAAASGSARERLLATGLVELPVAAGAWLVGGVLVGTGAAFVLAALRRTVGARAAAAVLLAVGSAGVAVIVKVGLAGSDVAAGALPLLAEPAGWGIAGLGGLIAVGTVLGLLRLVWSVTPSGEADHGPSVAAAVVMLAAYALVAARLIPEGVNQDFLSWSGPLLLLAGVAAVVAERALGDRLLPRARMARRASGGLMPALALGILVVIPVVRYLLLNRQELGALPALAVLGAFAAAAAVLVGLVPWVLRRAVDPLALRVGTAGLLFVLVSMASLSASRLWFDEGSLPVQLGVLILAVAALAALAAAPGRALPTAVTLYLALDVGAVVFAGVAPRATVDTDGADVTTGAWEQRATTDLWERRPDVLMLVYESYGSPESLATLGFAVEDQIAFLEEEGFVVHDGTYTVAPRSLPSMSRVLDAATSIEPDEAVEQRRRTAGDSVVARVLASQGYRTAGVFASDYFFGPLAPSYDLAFPTSTAGGVPLASGILRGEFRAEASYGTIDDEVYLAQKRRLLADPGEAPLFLYSHNTFPGHSQNSGRCLPNELELYAGDLARADAEMRADIEAIGRERDAIVIVASDHGPYLTLNCNDVGMEYVDLVDRLALQDRYGVLLAVRYPEGLGPGPRPHVLQDVLASVVSVLAGDPWLWDERPIVATTLFPDRSAGVTIVDGIIRGGPDDGERFSLAD